MALNKISSANRADVRSSLDDALPAVGGDVNPIVDWVNNISNEVTAVNTATGNSVTLNSVSGTVTSGTLSTLTSLGSNSITVNNTNCTANSTVLITVTATGTGAVAVTKVVANSGSFVATFSNIGAITGTITFKFIIL